MVYFIRLTFNEQKEFHLFMNIEHSYPFDPTNGMTQEELLAVAPGKEPEGFREFWEENFALVANAPLKYNVETEVWSPVPEEKIYRVRVTNYDGVEFVTWITRPANSQGALVIGQGYGNIATASASKHSLTVTYTAVRGLGPSQCKDIPWQPSAHVLYGIDSKENYILRGVIADQWMTLRVLLDMFPDCVGNINYSGGSMGGGMGVAPLGIEPQSALGDGSHQTRAVEIALGDEKRTPAARPVGHGRHRLGKFPQHVLFRSVDDGVDSVEAQAVEVKRAQKIERAVDDKAPDLGPREIDRLPPGRVRAAREVGAQRAQVTAGGAEVVVDDVEEDAQPQPVRRVDKARQSPGACVYATAARSAIPIGQMSFL